MKKIIIIFIVIVLLVFGSIFFLVFNNDKYSDRIELEIKENYDVKDKIIYLNKYDLYYIILTNKNLIVLDENYEEVLKEDSKKIIRFSDKYEIVYRLNSVMFEKKKISSDKIIYEYYDIYNNEFIDTLEIGG